MASPTKLWRHHIDDDWETHAGDQVKTDLHPRPGLVGFALNGNYVRLSPLEARMIATDLLIRSDQAESLRT